MAIKSTFPTKGESAGKLAFTAKVTFKSGKEKELKKFGSIDMADSKIDSTKFKDLLNVSIADPQTGIQPTDEIEGTVSCVGYLLDTIPVPVGGPITIVFSKGALPSMTCAGDAPAVPDATP